MAKNNIVFLPKKRGGIDFDPPGKGGGVIHNSKYPYTVYN